MMMKTKRITLFAGHYGSGKTNIAVNFALRLAAQGKKVALGDLDIVNPYYRAKDSQRELKAAGVRLIASAYANSNVDVPALLPMAILNLIMSAGSLMNVGFEKVWLLQTDLNKATSDVIAVYVYQQGIENAKYSYSTAVGLFNTAVNLILLFVVNTIASKTSEVNFV